MSSLKTPSYWRSLAEWAQDPEVAARISREFPTSPLDTPDDSGFARRRFLQLMGASMALASGAACRWEKQKILAFTRRPAGHVPGVPKHFATMFELGGFAQPLHATSYDGRPIKVDGNPKHPGSGGASTAFAQASILELYDPDRSQTLHKKLAGDHESEPSWDDFAAWLAPVRKNLLASQGAGLVVIAEKTSSPTMARLRAKLLAEQPKAKWVAYEPLAYDNERAGTKLAFGAELQPIYSLREARAVLALDADLFVDHPNALVHSSDFAAARRPEGDWMVRLWAAESRFTATGGAADHRLALRSQQVGALLRAVAKALCKHGVVGAAEERAALESGQATALLADPEAAAFVRDVAADLAANRGRSAIVVGEGQPAEVHQLAHQCNALLGNVGATVRYVTHPDAGEPAAREALTAACAQMRAGKVGTLLLLGGNPVFDAPSDLNFGEAITHVAASVHLSLFQNETSLACSWHLPRTHYLEAWGDGRSYAGDITLAQPLIEPLYPTCTASELVAMWLGIEHEDHELVRTTFDAGRAGDAESLAASFRQAVQSGFVANSAWPAVQPVRRPLRPAAMDGATDDGNGHLELTFWTDSHVYDGRFANNGWLQELPDFMSKLTWDNAAFFGPATAKALGVVHEKMVELSVAGRKLSMPAYVMPGQARGSVAVHLGYGRTAAGHVAGLQHGGVDSAGFNTYLLRDSSATNMAQNVSVAPSNKSFDLAVTQDHHSLDTLAIDTTKARIPQIVREGDWQAYKQDPAFAKEMVEHPPLKSLWREITYEGHRWGMAIDLNACTGCNACIVACQAENNIPVVGKEDVLKGREMHWLRLDRYFSGSPEAPKLVSQPMLCQQCELAPCESVCPVAATVHSNEGLNDMVYNRCIGTRYCSNNCPYKVRRFNFFNYHKSLEKNPDNQVTKMVYNPEVTVRARGVMEKCTYCVQRIQNVKIRARNEKRAIVDGEITTACAQACASEAIVFGDLNDASSKVAKSHQSPRAYGVLEELNTKPRTQYLARVRNPYGNARGASPTAPHGASPSHEPATEQQG